QNDVTLKMPAFEWVHVQLHQQKGMISLSPPTICNSALPRTQTSKPQQPSFFGCCGVLMNPFALRERRQILCSRRWFRALKKL
ncbi:hypothetical protein QQE26_23315, partial [Salmonella enterica subsp. enterica serovar Muenster]|nr:hypothetical protein [Salmonella enterica subsp. enterica serovar Muenster]